MLEDYRIFGDGPGAVFVASGMENGQVPAIVSMNFNGFPCDAPLVKFCCMVRVCISLFLGLRKSSSAENSCAKKSAKGHTK